jgi:hypothetical protein
VTGFAFFATGLPAGVLVTTFLLPAFLAGAACFTAGTAAFAFGEAFVLFADFDFDPEGADREATDREDADRAEEAAFDEALAMMSVRCA